MRILPLALLLTAALLLAGCANGADESRDDAGGAGGASELNGQVDVVDSGNQTAQTNQTGTGNGTAPR